MRAAHILMVSAAVICFAGAANAQQARTCPASLKDTLPDNQLYVLAGKAWTKVGAGKIDRSSSLFAYTLNDDRDNDGGVVLVKSVDFGSPGKQRDLEVELHRDPVKRVRRGKVVDTDSGYVGSTSLLEYQDGHQQGRELSKKLRRFHTDYLYRGTEERYTGDPARRRFFVFDGFKLVPRERNPLMALLFGPAYGDVQGSEDGAVKKIRSTIKYYGKVAKAHGNAVCFWLSIEDNVDWTTFEVRDFDYPGPYHDGDEPLAGRKRNWKVVWK